MTTPPTDPSENPQQANPADPQPASPWAADAQPDHPQSGYPQATPVGPQPTEPDNPWAHNPQQPNPWAAPVGPPPPPQSKYADMYAVHNDPLNPDPFSAYSAGPQTQQPQQGIGSFNAPPPMFPVAPQPKGTGWKLGVVLTVFALILGGVIFWLATKDSVDFNSGASDTTKTTTTTAPTTTTPPKAFATIGDCVSLAGTRFQPTYDKVDCAADQHNYTVSKLPGRDEKCAEPDDNYTLFTNGRARVCLIPVFREGLCYEFGIGVSTQASNPVKPCGGFNIVKARVLRETVDVAACGQGQALTLAYPEIKTTYCFTHTR